MTTTEEPMTADNEHLPAPTPSRTELPVTPSDRERPPTLDRWETVSVSVLAAITLTVGATLAMVGAGADAIFFVAAVYITVVGIWLTIVDLSTHRLPDRIVVPSYGVLVALLTFSALSESDVTFLGRAAITATLTGLIYGAMNHWSSMGFGDVKLGILLGFILGWAGWDSAIAGPVLGFILAFIVAITLLIAGKGRDTYIAFGPHLIGGALIAIAQHMILNR